ncbi:hypothetical protein GCM10012275_19570 [Longimycelium tulufanense]|uniref:Adenylate kinase n=1 Tax=Longimycelium tulufanense TaxID=907463 RepID=A0A8J3CCH1_9PSEU|nr:hypothetical protein [Longimycelium tulufanense]GGM48717.1 hypothetical protein GCM10012275_19570 [Longimycelium tulufanense]
MTGSTGHPERIAVLGSPGSGKSRFCHLLAHATGLPLFHLDDLYWYPGWQRTPDQEWESVNVRLAAQPAWIIDGNYLDTVPHRVRRADLVVVLDHHPLRCVSRLVGRSMRLRRRGAANAGSEYLPRRLRHGVDPPVRDLSALVRKALGFRNRELAVMRDLLSTVSGEVRFCRSQADCARLLRLLHNVVTASSPVPGLARWQIDSELSPCSCPDPSAGRTPPR